MAKNQGQDPKKIQEENELLRKQLELLKKRNELQEDSFNLSSASLDSIKELFGIQSRSTTFEQATLKTNKEINNSILNQKTGLSSINEIQKQIQKNQDLIKKSKIIESSLEKQIGGELSKRGKKVSEAISQQKELVSQLENTQNLSKEEYESLLKQISSNDIIIDQNLKKLSSTEQQYILTQQNTEELKKQSKVREAELNIQKQLEKRLGIAGAIFKGLGAIPGIGRSAAEAMSEVTEEIQKQVEESGKLPSRWETFGKIVGKTFKSISYNLTDPAVIIGGLVSIFKELDDSGEKFARSMNMTYEQSLNFRNNLTAVAGVTKTQLLESITAVGDALGSNAALNDKDVATFTRLRELAGLTNEELMGAQKLSLANGRSLESNVNTITKTVSQLNKQSGIYLNEKTVLKDINNLSAATTLSLGKNPKELAKAVSTAKALGMEMSKLEGISESLLNFESSIENELSAELLTGQNINLERARLLALNNDVAGVAEEINKQIGSSADYTKMNRIQQEALAKAVGMNREELAQTLFTQEQLQGLNKDEAARRQAILDQRIEEVGLEQAQRELEQGGIENLEKQAGIQTKFNQQILELKDMLANEILPIFTSIGTFITEHIGLVKTLLGLYIAMKGIILISNAAQALGISLTKKQKIEEKKEASASIIGNAFKMAGGLGPLGIALVAGIIGAGIGALAMYAADDIVSPAPGGSGYGKRVLLGPEGAFSLNNNDTVVAGTDLGINKANDMAMAPAGGFKVSGGGDNKAVVAAINELRQGLAAIANRPINVSIDGEKVIKATTGNNPNTDGDEMRKNGYKIS